MFDGAVAEQRPGPIGGREELSGTTRLGEAIGVQKEPVAWLEMFHPGLHDRIETEWWSGLWRLQCDDPTAPQQQR